MLGVGDDDDDFHWLTISDLQTQKGIGNGTMIEMEHIHTFFLSYMQCVR